MENEIAQVLGPADPLESAVEFSPIERINSIFPNGIYLYIYIYATIKKIAQYCK